MCAKRAESRPVNKAADVLSAYLVRLHERGAKTEFGGQFQHWLPEVIVVDDDKARLFVAATVGLFDDFENVRRVKHMTDDDVVECAVEVDTFGVPAGSRCSPRVAITRQGAWRPLPDSGLPRRHVLLQCLLE